MGFRAVPKIAPHRLRVGEKEEGRKKAEVRILPVKRYVSIFPRKERVGIVAWVFTSKYLTSCAFASIPISNLNWYLQMFAPDSLVVEPYREGEWEAAVVHVTGVTDLRYAHPSWREAHQQIPKGVYITKVSPLAHRAFALGFNFLFTRGPYMVDGGMSIHELTPSWLEEYGAGQ